MFLLFLLWHAYILCPAQTGLPLLLIKHFVKTEAWNIQYNYYQTITQSHIQRIIVIEQTCHVIYSLLISMMIFYTIKKKPWK